MTQGAANDAWLDSGLPGAASVPGVPAGWRALLALNFTRGEHKTVLRRGRQFGPLTVQKPFYPEGDHCHVYLLHPPGGIVGGDSLQVDINVGPGAGVLLTSPGSTKVYRSGGRSSSAHQQLRVAPGGCLEWLPSDTILFGASDYRLSSHVELEPGAIFSGWEIVSLGRPISGDDYGSGKFEQRLRISVGGKPALIEKQGWDGGKQGTIHLLAGYRVFGTWCTYPADAGLVKLAQTAFENNQNRDDAETTGALIGVTLLGDLMVVRALADDPFELRQQFAKAWSTIRQRATGRKPSPPRIWAT